MLLDESGGVLVNDPVIDPETGEPKEYELDESQANVRPGILQRGQEFYRSQVARDRTTQALAKTQAAKKTLGAASGIAEKAGFARTASFFAAFGPEIIAGILILVAIITSVLAIAFVICSYQGCNGKNAGDAKSQPATNVQDALDLKTAKCLDKAAKVDKDGNGPLPPECIEPIKAWSQIAIDMATRMLPKVPKPESAEGQAATKILNELLAAAKEANGITTSTTVKTAQEQRKRLEDAWAAANANAIIQKLSGISENMKKVIAYIQQNNPKQQFDWDCYETDNTILQKTFNVNHATAFAGPELPGYDTSGAPTSEAIEATKNALRKGGIPIWFIRGSYSGQHYIIILNIDESNNIFYYDPAGGGTHNDPSTWAGTGNNKFFFGSPLPPFKSGNKAMRGYVFQP